jgi:hypothetical protein
LGNFTQSSFLLTKESIIDWTCFSKISPNPSFSKRGIPPFGKRERRRDFVFGVYTTMA